MKILHVYRTYFPDTQGGLEEAIRQICLCTAVLGVENRILTLQRHPGDPVLERPEGRVYRSPRHLSIASCDMGFRMRQLFQELLAWCDLVHYHFPWPFGDLLACMSGTDKPYVVTYHSDIVRQRFLSWIYAPLMHRFLRGAGKIVATSQNYVDSSAVLEHYRSNVRVVPLGLDEASYPKVTNEMRDRAKSTYGEGFFLFIGVFRYYKGLHILLEAVTGSDHQMVLAGDGPLKMELEDSVAENRLNNIFFAGFVSDEEKMALLSLCRAVVFPSHLRSEAFGVSLLEAAMMGKPMISAEVGTGTSFVNVDGETGKVVTAGSPVELRAAMDFLAGNEGVADEMGRNARARFDRLFTGEVIGQQYLSVYQQACFENSATVVK